VKGEARCEERFPFGFAQGKSDGVLLAMRELEIEERSLHYAARHANTARKKKPGYSGRDDRLGRAGCANTAPEKAGPLRSG